jgi:hypothetical protein
MGHFGESVHDNVNGIESAGPWEARDVVRLCPFPWAFGCGKYLQCSWWPLVRVFGLAAGVARLNVLGYGCCHMGPPILSSDKVEGS